MPRPSLARRCVAEGFATFALVFAGCGAIILDSERGGSLGAVGIAAAFGLVIMVMVYATGHLSGAHINPAVTVAFTLTRHLPVREAAVYVPSQLAGAVGAAAVLRLVWDGTPANLGATVPSVGVGAAFTYELLMTAFLMFVIMAVATDTPGGGGRCGDRHRRDGCARRDLRRRSNRRLDESRALLRPGARRVGVVRLLDLRARAAHRGPRRRAALQGSRLTHGDRARTFRAFVDGIRRDPR